MHLAHEPEIAGFTDAKGSETYNQGLSERRADAVRQLLSKQYGIEAGNLVTVGYGLSHPTSARQRYGHPHQTWHLCPSWRCAALRF
jgi:outer membrane protein OmpA-like peptidoglycan-associated protein